MSFPIPDRDEVEWPPTEHGPGGRDATDAEFDTVLDRVLARSAGLLDRLARH